MLHVCQQLASSAVQCLERRLLLLVTSASDLPMRTIKFRSVVFRYLSTGKNDVEVCCQDKIH